MIKVQKYISGAYFYLLLLAAGYFLWITSFSFYLDQKDFPILVFFFILGVLSGQKLIPVNSGRTLWLSLSDVILYFVLFAFPFPALIWFAALLSFSLELSFSFLGKFKAKKWILLNTCLFTISFGIGSLVFHFFVKGNLEQAISEKGWLIFPILALVWIVVSGVHTFNAALLQFSKKRIGILDLLRSIPDQAHFEDLASTFLGAILAVLFLKVPFAATLMVFPIGIFAFSSESYVKTMTDFSKLIQVLLKAIESSDPGGYNHSVRVANYSKEISLKMGLSSEKANEIQEIGLIHDLGTIAIPDSTLFKPGILSPWEWAVIKQHPVHTAEFLRPFTEFKPELFSAKFHHERWDGRGYPAGLKKEDIPLSARIVCAADAYDAMTSDKPYRKRLLKEVALRRMWMGRGIQFDPEVVKALFLYLEEEEPEPFDFAPPLWIIAQSLGIEQRLLASKMDDLHEAVIMHEVNPPSDIFAKPGESSSFWWQVDYREHIGITDGLRQDFPTSEEAVKILWTHHEWHKEGDSLAPVEARILGTAEAFFSCLTAGMEWPAALLQIRERAGSQFDPDIVSALEVVIAKGNLPYSVLLGIKEEEIGVQKKTGQETVKRLLDKRSKDFERGIT
jgi:HD-GYP domain-containing protein (c-di-GMP phosphodiesterase class II)